jgi:hypothetical protein
LRDLQLAPRTKSSQDMINEVIIYIKDRPAVDWPNILQTRDWPGYYLTTAALGAFMVYIMFPEWIADMILFAAVQFMVLTDAEKDFLDNHYYPTLKNAIIDVKTTPDFWRVYPILFGIGIKLL